MKRLLLLLAVLAVVFAPLGCGQSASSYSEDVSKQVPKPKDDSTNFKNPGINLSEKGGRGSHSDK